MKERLPFETSCKGWRNPGLSLESGSKGLAASPYTLPLDREAREIAGRGTNRLLVP